jgi:hypothetical protein
MKQVLAGVIFILSFVACKKDNSTNSLSGLYTEVSPMSGRSQLKFISGNLVIKTEPSSSYSDTFKYSVTLTKITLTPNWTTQYPPQEFDFEKIDDKTIKIENLYPSIPEAPKSYMTYKK